MIQRVMVSASAVALVALVAGGAALALQSKGSPTPKTITVQGGGAAPATTNVAAGRAGLMAPNSNLVFVSSGDLPALDGGRPAWHLAANPTADPATVAALAKALGVGGAVNTVDGGWQVGDPQGTGPNLFVNNAPGLPWNYSNYAGSKMAYACASSGAAAPDSASTTSAPPPTCPAPTPPTGVPTKEAALAQAGDLMKALGIDASSLSITANASEWSADVQAVPSLGGIATPTLTTSFGFGGEGKLQYANGFLLAPEKADTYPRTGTTKAFDALKSGKGLAGWFSYGGPMTRNAVAVATIPPPTTAVVPAPTEVVPAPVPARYPSGPSGVNVTIVNTTVYGTICVAYDPASGTPRPPSPICMCSDALAAGVPVTTVPCSMPCALAASATTAAVGQKATPHSISCGPIECGGVAVTTIPGPPSTTVACAPVPCPLAGSATTAAVDQKAIPNSISCGPVECGGVAVTTIPGTAPVDASTAALMPACPHPTPLLVEPTTPPAPMTITISGVHETLLPLTGADGSMWLVPGYEFTSADGGTWPVLAIDQSFVDQVAPSQPIPEKPTTGGVAVTPTATTAPVVTTSIAG